MTTAENNVAVINSLITASNEVTGNEDTNLTSAVQSLIEGFGSGGGGSLAIKSGTIDVAGGYTLTIPHGCKKLPKWVFVEAPNDVALTINNLTFAFWQNNYASFTARASTTEMLNAVQMQKYENIAPESSENAVKVDEEKIVISSTQVFATATFTWYAIYEAD